MTYRDEMAGRRKRVEQGMIARDEAAYQRYRIVLRDAQATAAGKRRVDAAWAAYVAFHKARTSKASQGSEHESER